MSTNQEQEENPKRTSYSSCGGSSFSPAAHEEEAGEEHVRTPPARSVDVIEASATSARRTNEQDHQQQEIFSAGFPALAAASARTRQDDEDKEDKHPSDNVDRGDLQPDINRRHDETASQMMNMRRIHSPVQQQVHNQDNSVDAAPPHNEQVSSTRPAGSALVPVIVHARPGAYAIDGPAAGARHTVDTAAVAQTGQLQTLNPPAGTTTRSEPQDDAIVDNAVTTDDAALQLRSEIREEIQAETPTAEVVLATKPIWRRKSFLVIAFSLLLAAVGGIIGGVVSSRGANNDLPSSFPIELPTSSPTFDMSTQSITPTVDPVAVATVALVEGNSFDGGLSLENSSSPQYKALDWLLGNQDLSLYSDDRILQRFALATFYHGANGTGWTNSGGWLSNTDECLWYTDISTGTACRDGEHISDLHLKEQNLVGQLPSDLALLSASLVTIDFRYNSLSGPIPTEYGHLTKLERLAMLENDLSSSIPTEIGVMTRLDDVWLYENHLDGSIPSEIGQLSKLFSLNLFENELTGTVPSQLNELNDLFVLQLHGNNFTPPFACSDFITSCTVSCDDKRNTACREL